MVGSKQEKKLHIVRHGKAKSPQLFDDDFDRPLHKTGITQAHVLGTYLEQAQRKPQLSLCSEALRTKQTFQIVGDLLGLEQASFLRAMYLAPAEELITHVETLDDRIDEVLIVGHNDGLSDFLSRLTGESWYLQTCEYFELTFTTDTWKGVHWGTGIVTDHYTPRVVTI
jgi:phosphohistidine phosphatase